MNFVWGAQAAKIFEGLKWHSKVPVLGISGQFLTKLADCLICCQISNSYFFLKKILAGTVVKAENFCADGSRIDSPTRQSP